MTPALFHPLIARWFSTRFVAPTAPQTEGWRRIAAGRHTLISAPTGSGKTLAAFLWSIDRLVRRGLAGWLAEKTSVLYVSPLKALGNDIEKNLSAPLSEIQSLARSDGLPLPEIRVAVRTGDTPQRERQAMARRPPHILITTPESLYILLTAERSRELLKEVETIIVDEIHAVAGNKRGAHLALSLERLAELTGKPLQRIGLSATQKPVEEIARLLVGAPSILTDGKPDCAIVDAGHRREWNLSVEVPDQELGAIVTHDLRAEVFERIAAHARAHRTTLVFVHTRRLVERVAHALTARLGEGKVAAHHGSLSRKTRLEVERKLKAGELPVVVATASLELGIDIGHVDLVCHIGAPRALATLLQRVGRSGHWQRGVPKGILYPLTRDELVQCAAALRAVKAGELDRIEVPEKALDVLAQQIVATVASLTPQPRAPEDPTLFRLAQDSGVSEEALLSLVRRAYPYRNLTRDEFDKVIDMLAEGIASRRGRRSAYLHRDRVHGHLRARRGARLAAITNGGAIPDTADYDVVELPAENPVGKVNEDFAIESLAGDVFLLGNRSWRIRRVGQGKVWVEDANGAPPTVPFWLGEAPARTWELSRAVSELRRELAGRIADKGEAVLWLMRECGLPESAAEQIVSYVEATAAWLGCVPTQERIVAERFFDEGGGMQLVLHAPFGGRITRAWGLALRKRFCVTFDFELQAAATDDGVVLSLGERHSFPLGSVFSYLHPATAERDLVQAVLGSPIFTNRWRWNATRALALERTRGGKKVPMIIQRIRAEELLAAVFPEQVMCQDQLAKRTGPVTPPDHPLVNETLKDCLHEAMDLDGLVALLGRLERGEIQVAAVDTPTPSQMAHEILNAQPYAFLDDAPLEERRARAVQLRRTDPELASSIGALSREAIAMVCAEAWPKVRDAEEFHDLLLGVGPLPLGQAKEWQLLAGQLIVAGRAMEVRWQAEEGGGGRVGFVAAERLSWIKALFPRASVEPEARTSLEGETLAPEEALRRIVQGWMEISGPLTASELAERAGLLAVQAEQGLLMLESMGVVLRGRFSPAGTESEMEWCERGLLARIHRLTLSQLRREIEPVSPADFLRFLLRWQHVQPRTQLHGRHGVLEAIGQMQGLELPAPVWERDILPLRVAGYDPADLESLCLSGAVTWGRLRRGDRAMGDPVEEGRGGEKLPSGRRLRRRSMLTRSVPITFLLREHLESFLEPLTLSWEQTQGLSPAARAVGSYLERHGASFLSEIGRGTGYLLTQAEAALWELVARGLVTGDGIAGLRTLITPEAKRLGRRRGLRLVSGGRGRERLVPLGRWSLWRTDGEQREPMAAEVRGEILARQLLRRYGVVCRDLLARESLALSWRLLVQTYRRLEARGEIRGGQFVSGFVGEQFALPEAVEALRAVRREGPESRAVLLAAGDPLNLIGILTPGPRISPYSNQTIVYLNGVPVDVGPLGAVRKWAGGDFSSGPE